VALSFSETYSPEEVEEMGSRLIGLLELASSLGAPEVRRVLEAARGALDDVPRDAPGAFGLLRILRQEDTRRGVALLLEVCRRVGHAANNGGEGPPVEGEGAPPLGH
jgi:uncharacterized protein YjgD (DUF1641 family)